MRPLVGVAALPVPPGYATGPMLSDCCLSCPICLSVNLVYCGQTVEWIKMKLGMQVGLLCPGHNVLDGDRVVKLPVIYVGGKLPVSYR